MSQKSKSSKSDSNLSKKQILIEDESEESEAETKNDKMDVDTQNGESSSASSNEDQLSDKDKKKDKKQKKEKKEKKSKKEKKAKKSKKEKKEKKSKKEKKEKKESKMETSDNENGDDAASSNENDNDDKPTKKKELVPANFVPVTSKCKPKVDYSKITEKENEIWLIRVPHGVPIESLDGLKVDLHNPDDHHQIATTKIKGAKDKSTAFTIHDQPVGEVNYLINVLPSQQYDKLLLGKPFTKNLLFMEDVNMPTGIKEKSKKDTEEKNKRINAQDLKNRWVPIGVTPPKQASNLDEILMKHHPFTKEAEVAKKASAAKTPKKVSKSTKETPKSKEKKEVTPAKSSTKESVQSDKKKRKVDESPIVDKKKVKK